MDPLSVASCGGEEYSISTKFLCQSLPYSDGRCVSSKCLGTNHSLLVSTQKSIWNRRENPQVYVEQVSPHFPSIHLVTTLSRATKQEKKAKYSNDKDQCPCTSTESEGSNEMRTHAYYSVLLESRNGWWESLATIRAFKERGKRVSGKSLPRTQTQFLVKCQ